MIEKLETYKVEVIETGKEAVEANPHVLTAKVIELIEAVNKLEKYIKTDGLPEGIERNL